MILIFLLVFAGDPSFAHKLHSHSGHEHKHEPVKPLFQIKIGELGETRPLTQEEVNYLVESSHEIIEGDHFGNFFKRWAQAFNLKSKFIDGYRWASAKSVDPRFKDTVTDSLLLFGFSHLLEMLTGPAMLLVGANNEWPHWLMAAVGAAGTAISIPGLDPMCILIFAVYAKSADFRNAVGVVRKAVMKNVNFVTLGSSLSQTYYTAPVSAQNESPIRLAIYSDKHGPYLQEVVIHKSSLAGLDSAALKTWLKGLGWNARNFVKKILQSVSAGKNLTVVFQKPYIVSVEEQNDFIRIELVAHAVRISKDSTCNEFLTEDPIE